MKEVAREVTLDFRRASRVGIDEAVLCSGKTVAQLSHILDEAAAAARSMLLTRLEEEQFRALDDEHQGALDYHSASRTGFFGPVAPPDTAARIAVVTAGTSDTGVAHEAVRTLAYAGVASEMLCDVGVAGLWRLLDHVDRLADMDVLIAVAGMDAALVSVLGGLVPGLIIAVPTSAGYGAARKGETAMYSALASCSPGIVVVNIDNGYGAACAALRVIGYARARRSELAGENHAS